MEQLVTFSNFLVLLFLFIFAEFSVSAVSTPVRYEGESMVVKGDSFQILCWLTVFDTMKWRKNGITLFSNENTLMTLSEDKSGGGIIGKLVIRKARENDTGEYTCSHYGGPGHTVVVMGDYGGFLFAINEAFEDNGGHAAKFTSFEDTDYVVGNFDFKHYKIMNFKTPLVLECNKTSNGMDYEVLWFKNDKPIDLSDSHKIEQPNRNTLVIHKTHYTDAGNYSCHFFHKGLPLKLNLNFTVVYKPVVKLPPHTSVVEGEKLTITCTIFSDPKAEVYWKIGNKTYEESEGRVKILDNEEKQIPKGILQIDEAEMSDRNTYICGASNVASKFSNATEASTFVRVKDKMAALWPFLGICAEVIILCTIILIYEKKRNKTELDESDTDGSPEQKNTPDHHKDTEVRHRK